MHEQLTALIKNLDVYNCEECKQCPSYKYDLRCDDDCFAGKLADYLISNGVVPVVRCKDCKNGEVDDPKDFPDQYYCHEGHMWNKGCHFCADGEQKGG